MSNQDDEAVEGYLDGMDPNSVEPSDNRSAVYRHSFTVGRADLARVPAFGGAPAARRRAAEAQAEDDAR